MTDIWVDWCKEISNKECCISCHVGHDELDLNLDEKYFETGKHCFIFTYCCKCTPPSEKQMRDYTKTRKI